MTDSYFLPEIAVVTLQEIHHTLKQRSILPKTRFGPTAFNCSDSTSWPRHHTDLTMLSRVVAERIPPFVWHENFRRPLLFTDRQNIVICKYDIWVRVTSRENIIVIDWEAGDFTP